jgi:hypothetical protein
MGLVGILHFFQVLARKKTHGHAENRNIHFWFAVELVIRIPLSGLYVEVGFVFVNREAKWTLVFLFFKTTLTICTVPTVLASTLVRAVVLSVIVK